MIERLLDAERSYGEPTYGKLSKEIVQLKDLLYNQLEQTGQGWLEQLTDAYLQQENAVLCDAFAKGFWSAMELMLEFYRGRTK